MCLGGVRVPRVLGPGGHRGPRHPRRGRGEEQPGRQARRGRVYLHCLMSVVCTLHIYTVCSVMLKINCQSLQVRVAESDVSKG